MEDEEQQQKGGIWGGAVRKGQVNQGDWFNIDDSGMEYTWVK